MPIPYYPDGVNKLWIKDSIAPLGTNVYYVRKISGYTPDGDKIFKCIDNFNDNSINTSKWFTDGIGTIEEINGAAHIVGTSDNKYPRFVTTTPVPLSNCILEYDLKVTGAAVDSCRIGYTSYYTDGNNTANWYVYVDGNRYINLWTRINGTWAFRWKSTSQMSLNIWYKLRFINNTSQLKIQLFTSSETLITESAFFSYDNVSDNSIYFGQRSIGDSGYFDNFIVRKYISTEPNIRVVSESGGYKVIVKNILNEELHDYQIKIPTTVIGSLTTTSSVCIDTLYKTPLTQPYYNLYNNCIMNIPRMDEDNIGNHTLVMYNGLSVAGRFNDTNNFIRFNGINTRGLITHNSDLDIFNTNNFTLICWLKQIGDYSTTWCSLLSKATSALNVTNCWKLQINKNNVGFLIQDCDSVIDCTNLPNPIKINDSNCHMLTFVRNGSYLYAYKDNSLVQTISLAGMCNFSNAGNIDVGCVLTSLNYDKFFNGMFGETIIYNSSFNSKNILNYYNLTKFKYIPITTNIYKY